jgi:tetratricopeptide (TPR) repeat protein
MATVSESTNHHETITATQERLQELRRTVGNQHESTIQTLETLAEEYQAFGDYDNAEKQYREAIQIRQETGNPSYAMRIMFNLGVLLNRGSKYVEAESILKQVLPMLRQRGQPDDSVTAQNFIHQELGAIGQLVASLEGQHKSEEAEIVAKSSFVQLEKLAKPDRESRLAAFTNSSAVFKTLVDEGLKVE